MHRFAAWPLVAAVLLAPVGCRPDGRDGLEPVAVELPEPLPLPDDPVAAAWIERPGALLAEIDPWIAADLNPTATLERGLAQFTTPEMARTLAAAVDAERPWASVRLADGEELAHLPVRADAVADLAQSLGSLSAEGEFGAVRLPEAPPVEDPAAGPWSRRPHLAWLDRDAGTLTIATGLRALVTGRTLAARYGETPVFLTIDGSMLPEIVPIARATARGTLDDLEVVAVFDPDTDPLAGAGIADGALTGLLAVPEIALGGSTRVPGHEELVRDTIVRIDEVVERQSFLVQGLLEDLQTKLNAALRTWNGRVLVALGPPGHVRVAYGADDPKKSGVAVLRFAETVLGNLDFVRNFTSQVPDAFLDKNAGEAAGEPVHRLTVRGARSLLPEPAHALLDDKGRLLAAAAWSRHAGAGVAVVGPRPVVVLEQWLAATADQPTGAATLEDLGSARIALDPAQAAPLAQGPLRPEPWLALEASTPARTFVARRVDARTVSVRVVTERPRPARLQREAPSPSP
jgi:hypothetical protein